MILALAQKSVLNDVIRSWLLPKSNFVLVCPPMNAERSVIDFLTSKESIYEAIGEKLHSLALAGLDTSDFKDDKKFAMSVARCWDVNVPDGIRNDPHAILEFSCQAVLTEKRSPIIIVHRFHEALDKLGEDIGTTLRNLEHSHGLKTVVTMPVSLVVLRERWAMMDSQKAPFLASDWGQGHRVKVLKGYNLGEVISQGSQRGIADSDCTLLFKSTGGLVDIVCRVIDEIEGKKGPGLLQYLKSRSPELCERLLTWLDPKSTSLTYTKSIIAKLDSSYYPDDSSFINHHDWSSFILGKDGMLNFNMLAWAAVEKMARCRESNLMERLESIYARKDYDAALVLIDVLCETDNENRVFWSVLLDLTIFARAASSVFSNSGQWIVALNKLSKILVSVGQVHPFKDSIPALALWRPICEMLSGFFLEKSRDPNVRLEKFICVSGARELVIPFLQLLVLRLDAIHEKDEFTSLQAILVGPESLLQVYAFFELGICFWKFPQPSKNLSDRLDKLARKSYKIHGEVLGYSDLAHLIVLYEEDRDLSLRLIPDAVRLREVLSKYEVRKESFHSTAFTDTVTYREYRDFFLQLLNNYASLLGRQADISLKPPQKFLLELLKSSPKLTM